MVSVWIREGNNILFYVKKIVLEKPNFTIINEYSNGDAAIKKMLLQIIIEEFPVEKEKYTTSFHNRDFIKTKEVVHKLKNKIRVLGLTHGCKIAVDYEKQLLDENIALHHEFEKILDSISEFVIHIKSTI